MPPSLPTQLKGHSTPCFPWRAPSLCSYDATRHCGAPTYHSPLPADQPPDPRLSPARDYLAPGQAATQGRRGGGQLSFFCGISELGGPNPGAACGPPGRGEGPYGDRGRDEGHGEKGLAACLPPTPAASLWLGEERSQTPPVPSFSQLCSGITTCH